MVCGTFCIGNRGYFIKLENDAFYLSHVMEMVWGSGGRIGASEMKEGSSSKIKTSVLDFINTSQQTPIKTFYVNPFFSIELAFHSFWGSIVRCIQDLLCNNSDYNPLLSPQTPLLFHFSASLP